MTTCKVEYNQFDSIIEYVNYIPVGTETYFASWNPKTDYPLQVKGYWKCKIYKPFEEITYTRIELSVFVNGADHYEWIGTVKEYPAIVWEQIVTNNSLTTDIGTFKIVIVEDTMPTAIEIVRKNINHGSGRLFLLSANILHSNNTWYGAGISMCLFASNQYRLAINNNEELTAYGGRPVRLLFGNFE